MLLMTKLLKPLPAKSEEIWFEKQIPSGCSIEIFNDNTMIQATILRSWASGRALIRRWSGRYYKNISMPKGATVHCFTLECPCRSRRKCIQLR